jgi:hypothetical protein
LFQQDFEGFHQRKNNIFCHHTTKLFTDTFGLTPDEINNYTFPSTKCRSSADDCQRCLLNPECSTREGKSLIIVILHDEGYSRNMTSTFIFTKTNTEDIQCMM